MLREAEMDSEPSERRVYNLRRSSGQNLMKNLDCPTTNHGSQSGDDSFIDLSIIPDTEEDSQDVIEILEDFNTVPQMPSATFTMPQMDECDIQLLQVRRTRKIETIDLISPVSERVMEKSKTSQTPSCPICFIELAAAKSLHVTQCGHMFCSDCINSALTQSSVCPICRKKQIVKNLVPVFFSTNILS